MILILTCRSLNSAVGIMQTVSLVFPVVRFTTSNLVLLCLAHMLSTAGCNSLNFPPLVSSHKPSPVVFFRDPSPTPGRVIPSLSHQQVLTPSPEPVVRPFVPPVPLNLGGHDFDCLWELSKSENGVVSLHPLRGSLITVKEMRPVNCWVLWAGAAFCPVTTMK